MYFAEFFGTLVFILSILCITSITGLNKIQIAIGIGLALAISILLALGLNDDAVAHLNPAVSVGMMVKGDISYAKGLYLIITQLVAALLALFIFSMSKTSS